MGRQAGSHSFGDEIAFEFQGSVFDLYLYLFLSLLHQQAATPSQHELHCTTYYPISSSASCHIPRSCLMIAQERLTPIPAEAGPAELHSQVFILL